MTNKVANATLILSAALLAACGGDDEPAEPTGEVLLNTDAPVITFTPEDASVRRAGEPVGPLTIAYRIIGTPVVDQPVAIDIKVTSSLGDLPVTVSYRISDATAMDLAEAQPAEVVYTPDENDELAPRQVTVIPRRAGRLFLNVQASVDTRDGSLSTVTAIPLPVAEGA